MAAFLPKQSLWKWSTKGHKKQRNRILHKDIQRQGEKLAIGDCAIFLSTGRPDRPFVGRLVSLWETNSGQMRVKVRWFYHPTETVGTAPGGRRVDNLKLPVRYRKDWYEIFPFDNIWTNVLQGALFESDHCDENDVQTIAHSCKVLDYTDYKKIVDEDPSRLATIYENNDLYYLAGKYAPVEGTIEFEENVLDD